MKCCFLSKHVRTPLLAEIQCCYRRIICCFLCLYWIFFFRIRISIKPLIILIMPNFKIKQNSGTCLQMSISFIPIPIAFYTSKMAILLICDCNHTYYHDKNVH